MVYHCYDIISQVKRANDDTDIKVIVEDAIHQLTTKRGKSARARRMFITNLIMALRYEKAEGLAEGVAAKVTVAIEHLETIHKREPYNLF